MGFVGHLRAAGAESDAGAGHEDTRGGDHAGHGEGVDGGLIFEGGAFDGDEGVDGDALGVRLVAGEGLEHREAIFEAFAHADDAAGADVDAGAADAFEGVEAILVGAGGDDLVVVVGAGVEVVVVGGEPGFGEAFGLGVGEHAEGAAGLEAEGADGFDHVEDLVELFAVARGTPCGTHAESRGAVGFGSAGGLQHGVDIHEVFAGKLGVVMGGLGAVAAIFGAAAGLDAEKRAELDAVGVVVLAVDGLRAVDEFGEGELVDGADLGEGPVVPGLG